MNNQQKMTPAHLINFISKDYIITDSLITINQIIEIDRCLWKEPLDSANGVHSTRHVVFIGSGHKYELRETFVFRERS